MTTVEINRSGTDQTSLDLFQTGSYQTSVSLRHDLLDSKLNYHFAVTSLSVPLNDCPIFKLTGPTVLFEVERRNVGVNAINNGLRLHEPGNVFGVVGIGPYTIRPDNKFFDIASFLKDIANWCRLFNQHWTDNGFDPTAGGYSGVGAAFPALNEAGIIARGDYYNFINVKLSADGTLQFVGSAAFWNNFVFRFNRVGAAILGFFSQIQEVNRVGDFGGVTDPKHYFIARTLAAGVFTSNWLQEGGAYVGQVLLANMVQDATISSSHPLYQSVDQRVRVSVESHLPMASNVAILDEKETVNRSIAEAYFESKLENQIKFNESGVLESMHMTSAMYAGMVNFIKKSDMTFQWNKLMTAYEIKLFRFQLYIWYRVWNDTTGQWGIQKSKLSIPDEQFWEMTVRFVSDS